MSPASVSVVMTVYNGRRFLLEQAASIILQLKTGDELIVVDDASTDDSVALLESLNSPFIHILRNPVNVGVIRAFERGLAIAGHEIIFLSDQDDVWLPGKRSAFVAAFESNPGTLVVISDAELIDGDGRGIAPSFMQFRRGFKSGLIATLWRNRYLGCAMAIRRTLLRFALPIPAAVPMQDMWLGVLGRIKGDVVYLETPYLQYRRHNMNVTPLYSQGRWRNMIRWRFNLVASLVVRLLARRRAARVPG